MAQKAQQSALARIGKNKTGKGERRPPGERGKKEVTGSKKGKEEDRLTDGGKRRDLAGRGGGHNHRFLLCAPGKPRERARHTVLERARQRGPCEKTKSTRKKKKKKNSPNHKPTKKNSRIASKKKKRGYEGKPPLAKGRGILLQGICPVLMGKKHPENGGAMNERREKNDALKKKRKEPTTNRKNGPSRKKSGTLS